MTESVLPRLKRETSEISLSSISTKRESASQRYRQREVDIQGKSQSAEAKAKTKAHIEDELRGAIAALKKPNPRMAVKEFVDAADQRVDQSRSRKARHPMRNPFAAQVMATPSRDRKHSQLLRPESSTKHPFCPPKFSSPVSSQVLCSATKPSWAATFASKHSATTSSVSHNVEKTPTKSSARADELDTCSGKRTLTKTPTVALQSPEAHRSRSRLGLLLSLPASPAALGDIPTNVVPQRDTSHVGGDDDVGVFMTPLKTTSLPKPVEIDDCRYSM